MKTFDYIIVGAGSAGCVLANRLSSKSGLSILLLEAGGSDRHPYIQAPAGFLKTFEDRRLNWCYTTEAGHGVREREIFFPRGRVLGGSSSISGHLYVRGQAMDFDRWAELGNQGWSYRDVLPYFIRSEDRSTGKTPFHGVGGPQHVSDVLERHPLCEVFLRGAEELGLTVNPDYNGESQEGVSYYQRMILNGRRHSAAAAFLHPVRKRMNLELETDAVVERLTFEGKKRPGWFTSKMVKRVGRRQDAKSSSAQVPSTHPKFFNSPVWAILNFCKTLKSKWFTNSQMWEKDFWITTPFVSPTGFRKSKPSMKGEGDSI